MNDIFSLSKEEVDQASDCSSRLVPVAKVSPYKEAESLVLASLKGTVVTYDSPTEPVAGDGWRLEV